MSLVETSPRRELIPFIAKTMAAWCEAHGASDRFWLGNGMGGRVVDWLEAAISSEGSTPVLTDIDSLLSGLAVLVRAGVAGGTELEVRLSTLKRLVH
jgi:purine nucleoside permease